MSSVTRDYRFEEVGPDGFTALAAGAGLELPIEQTRAWAAFDAALDDRRPWGWFALERGGEPLALLALSVYRAHGYHYLWAKHGPVWVGEASPEDEEALIEHVRRVARARDKRIVFARLHLVHDTPRTRPLLSTITYDQTVVIDTSGTLDDVLARMKSRGRRDVRKALRESPLACADETERAGESFVEYYEVMVETARRDGFVPSPMTTYQTMLATLGPSHCRVFAGRIEGRVVNWSIVTVSGGRAARYYAASRSQSMRLRVSDRLVAFECEALGARGITAYDLMGIGSDLAPQLSGLNEFKTKFTAETTAVAPARDVAVSPLVYRALEAARDGRAALRERTRAQRGTADE